MHCAYPTEGLAEVENGLSGGGEGASPFPSWQDIADSV
jgi:hypothetical protein